MVHELRFMLFGRYMIFLLQFMFLSFKTLIVKNSFIYILKVAFIIVIFIFKGRHHEKISYSLLIRDLLIFHDIPYLLFRSTGINSTVETFFGRLNPSATKREEPHVQQRTVTQVNLFFIPLYLSYKIVFI